MNLNYKENELFRFYIKFVVSSLFSIIIFLIVTMNIKNRNRELQILLSRKSIANSQNEKMFLENLRKILDQNEILEDEMMNKHLTFELGTEKFFIKPNSIDKIIKVLKLCKEYSIDYFILGNGSNLLVNDKGYDDLVINIHEDNFSG